MISGNNNDPHQSHHLSSQLYCANLFSAVCTGDIDLFVQRAFYAKKEVTKAMYTAILNFSCKCTDHSAMQRAISATVKRTVVWKWNVARRLACARQLSAPLEKKRKKAASSNAHQLSPCKDGGSLPLCHRGRKQPVQVQCCHYCQCCHYRQPEGSQGPSEFKGPPPMG